MFDRTAVWGSLLSITNGSTVILACPIGFLSANGRYVSLNHAKTVLLGLSPLCDIVGTAGLGLSGTQQLIVR
jgi:hypothetical protein